jgi:hypothetical protein
MIMCKWNDKSEFKARVKEFAEKMDIELEECVYTDRLF